MIKPLIIIGVNDENNQLTISGPADKRAFMITVLADAIKIVAESPEAIPSPIIVPEGDKC